MTKLFGYDVVFDMTLKKHDWVQKPSIKIDGRTAKRFGFMEAPLDKYIVEGTNMRIHPTTHNEIVTKLFPDGSRLVTPITLSKIKKSLNIMKVVSSQHTLATINSSTCVS